MTETYPKNEKLKSKKHLDMLFSVGKSVSAFPIKMVYSQLEAAEDSSNKVGVSVPKRNFKRAVDRNELKRLLREVYRKNKYLLADDERNYACMFIFTGRKPEAYDVLLEKMEKVMHKFLAKEKQESRWRSES